MWTFLSLICWRQSIFPLLFSIIYTHSTTLLHQTLRGDSKFDQNQVVKMEGQAVRRRINMIASHFVPTDEHLSPTHVLPMNCSSTLNSVIRRADNKLYFARQGSAYQPNFMRQGSNEDVIETANQNNSTTLNSATRRFDNRLYFARQGAAYQASYMKQASNEEVIPAQSGTPHKYSGSGNEGLYYVSQERPLFSRPSSTEFKIQSEHPLRPSFQVQATELHQADTPQFAVPSRIVSQQKEQYFSRSNVIEWSPRTDVAESGRNYVITVEIPGVGAKDIRVEVDDKKLTVAGKRSTEHWKVAGSSSYDSTSAYLRREIIQGPYEVVWPLPANVNKDNVSAEFMDGFLRVVIPKL